MGMEIDVGGIKGEEPSSSFAKDAHKICLARLVRMAAGVSTRKK